MSNLGKRKIVILVIPLAGFLLFGLSFSLSQAQSESETSEQLQVAPVQLSEALAASPVISMDLQDADLKDVLKIFSQQADLNFIASENVKERKITLYLDKVPVEDALTTIMNANNLTYEQKADSKIFVVRELGRPGVETITRVFPLQYARVKGYELTAAGKGKRESKKIGIKEIIQGLLTTHGQVIEDSRTNSLVVIDVPSQFIQIEKAIKELDIKLPQVMIEAEVIETSLATIDKLGIEWGGSTEGELITGFGAARSTKWPFVEKGEGVGADGNPTSLYTGYLSAMNLGGTLAMLKRDTDTKILARPKILTLNNEPAQINITANTAIAAQTQQISSTGGGIDTSVITPERTTTGVTLKVTPQINQKGEITMIIEPSVINVKASAKFDVYDPQKRSAKTMVTVRNGETVIIGGLIKTEDTKILRKVPFLGDIPLLGNVFRKKDDETTDRELIIFITPHLVKEGEKAPGLALKRQTPWEYENLNQKEKAIERILDKFEE